ncbi:1341_t:CDS:2, partial [Funneliformis caledonium]
YYEEVFALSEALERLSSLPRELNNWYGPKLSSGSSFRRGPNIMMLLGYFVAAE